MQHDQATVNDVMTPHPAYTPLAARVAQAALTCQQRDVHYLLVADEEGDLVGITCQCRLRSAASEQRVVDVTKKPAVYIRSGEPVAQALHIMGRCQIGCLPVIEEQGVVCGIVTRHDFLEAGLAGDDLMPRCSRCGSGHNLRCAPDQDAPIFCRSCAIQETGSSSPGFAWPREQTP